MRIFRLLTDPDGPFRVFCIAGAGRGPLVARCLTAIERARRAAFVYAVEKNPNAWVTYVIHTQDLNLAWHSDFLVSQLANQARARVGVESQAAVWRYAID